MNVLSRLGVRRRGARPPISCAPSSAPAVRQRPAVRAAPREDRGLRKGCGSLTHGSTGSRALGQSVWIDFLSRESIRGGLAGLIDEDSVVGATSNPTIFQKAMTAGDAYDEQLRELRATGDAKDDLLGARRAGHPRGVRHVPPGLGRRQGRDGYVSLEVDPRLAYDTLATFREAMRLHEPVERPNLMVKIPATKPGLAGDRGRDRQGHARSTSR